MTTLSKVEQMPLAETAANSAPVPMSSYEMVRYAVDRGSSIEVVEKMIVMAERLEANQARKRFDEAMAHAKAEIPVIGKNRTVDFTSSKGRTHYRHEDLGEIARVVSPILGRHGLSYRFRTNTAEKVATVTCVISHRDGHYEENTLAAHHDDSGNKNPIQQLGSAITYLQRMTLKAALGIAASDDDDGKASESQESKPLVSGDQLRKLRAALEVRNLSEERACKRFKVERLEDIYEAYFDACMKVVAAQGAQP